MRNKQQAEQTSRSSKVPWNGEFYVSYGSGRSWEDAVKYGFIGGGGGTWYSGTLRLLSPDDRIWVRIPQQGYVGVGRVLTPAEPIDDFMVSDGLTQKRLLDVASDPGYYHLYADDPDRAEYVVGVEWLDHVTADKAIDEHGLFAQQNTVCRPVAPSWNSTIERLKVAFPNWNAA